MSNTGLRIGWDLQFSNRNFLALSMQVHGGIIQHRTAHAACIECYLCKCAEIYSKKEHQCGIFHYWSNFDLALRVTPSKSRRGSAKKIGGDHTAISIFQSHHMSSAIALSPKTKYISSHHKYLQQHFSTCQKNIQITRQMESKSWSRSPT